MSDFYSIKNKTQLSADLYFYGDIVSSWWGAWDDSDQYPENIKNFLDSVKGIPNLNIYINSFGGSVFAGMAIYNMLKRHKAYKTVYIDGLAASIASVIALAGDKVIIPANAFFMIHNPHTSASGNAEDMRSIADLLDKVGEGILSVYSKNAVAGVTDEAIRDMMRNEKWFTGTEAAAVFNVEASDAIEIAAYADSEAVKHYVNKPDLLASKTPAPIPPKPEPSNGEDSADSGAKSKADIELRKAKLKLLCLM